MARKPLEFKTAKEQKAGRTTRVVLSFAAFVLVFGLLSMLYLLHTYDYDLSGMFAAPEETTDPQETETAQPLQGSATLLLTAASKNDDLILLALVHVDLGSRQMQLCTLAPQQILLYEGISKSAQTYYTQGGVARVRQALQAQYGIRIDRYLHADETGFKSALNTLGGIRITIEKRIEHREDSLNLVLLAGEQTIKADTMLRYVKYNTLCAQEGVARQAALLEAMLRQYFTQANVAKGEKLYTTLVNALSSDISILDYTSNQKALEYLANTPGGFSVVIEQTPQWQVGS